MKIAACGMAALALGCAGSPPSCTCTGAWRTRRARPAVPPAGPRQRVRLILRSVLSGRRRRATRLDSKRRFTTAQNPTSSRVNMESERADEPGRKPVREVTAVT
jgi:hypothetical protein